VLPCSSKHVGVTEYLDIKARYSHLQHTVPRNSATPASLLKDPIGSSVHSLGTQLKHH
jgi:hypothetical protein